jgi:hypothetical protein
MSAKGLLYVNLLWFPMYPRKIPFKRQFLPSRVTRVSRLPMGKMQNYVSVLPPKSDEND